METQSNEISSLKKMRVHLESRIDTLHNAQIGLISSLQPLVPDIVSSLDLSIKVISTFSTLPFLPLPKTLHKPLQTPTFNKLSCPSGQNLILDGVEGSFDRCPSGQDLILNGVEGSFDKCPSGQNLILNGVECSFDKCPSGQNLILNGVECSFDKCPSGQSLILNGVECSINDGCSSDQDLMLNGVEGGNDGCPCDQNLILNGVGDGCPSDRNLILNGVEGSYDDGCPSDQDLMLNGVEGSDDDGCRDDQHLILNGVEGSDEGLGKNERVLVEGDRGALVRSMVAVCLLERVPFSVIDSSTLLRKLENEKNVTRGERAVLREAGVGGDTGSILAVEIALRSMAEDSGAVEVDEFVVNGKPRVMVMNIDRTKLLRELPESKQMLLKKEGNDTEENCRLEAISSNSEGVFGMGRPLQDMWTGGPRDHPHMQGFPPMFHGGMGPRGGPRGMVGMMGVMGPGVQVPWMNAALSKPKSEEEDEMKDLEALLNKKSFREMQKSKTGEELLDLIHRPTAKEKATAARFKSKGGSQVKEYCSALTKEDCRRQTGSYRACEKVHFVRITASHTDMSLGDCSFLDTCRHMKACKYVHYELDLTPDVPLPPMMRGGAPTPGKALKPPHADYCSEVELGEAQWINCDIRSFKMDILGKFGVVMADPPWDIHMDLPYGTMADNEMRTLNVPALQTDGLIFLWVTGRAMELGRECLELWGYKRVEEIIWVKTNQLQRIIRTGRTGHWLNHSKEHCLVGIKGNPEVNRNIDTNVIVTEVRETSRKPDEMYAMLERIMPRARKLELFARKHNCQAGWLSLGNQLSGVRLVNEGLRARFKAAYPDMEVQPASPPRSSAMEVDSDANKQNTPLVEDSSEAKPMNVDS